LNVAIATTVLLIAMEVAVILCPLIHYVAVGWLAKRNDIMDGLNAEARLAYFQMFSRGNTPANAAIASKEFEALYKRWYGRRFFVLPTLLLFIMVLTAASCVTFTVLVKQNYLADPVIAVPDAGIAALAGAYLWVANDIISRVRRLDISPSDVMWMTLRLAIAIPMGYAFASIASDSAGPFVAFALGAFPLSAISSMLRRSANKYLGLQATPEEASDDIIELQGVNRTIVERLYNEDITTVTQIAYCDPVQLTMRSNLTFNFITDCMNQALAWMYFEDLMDKLRPLGMRGAVEIRQLLAAFDSLGTTADEQHEHAVAVASLPKIATAVGIDADVLRGTFRQIAEDPYAIFLEQVWM
jgi:hypothetical protein